MDFSNETPAAHYMFYSEREHLKRFVDHGAELADVIIMIANWHSSSRSDVSFTEYAANWAVAMASRDIPNMRRHWQLCGKRMIGDNMTAWGSYKCFEHA